MTNILKSLLDKKLNSLFIKVKRLELLASSDKNHKHADNYQKLASQIYEIREDLRNEK